ncbi:MAG TPA: sulfur transferase domain-containing protein [Holophagaceae bacterium]|nr:sulfur transferase domain-containing protein [Holophagaceae bacterium]
MHPTLLPFLVPAMLAPQASALPGAVEARPGLFVVLGTPGAETFAGLKAAGITHVINLRTDAEGDFSTDAATTKASGAAYDRCPLDREPTTAALDAFRAKVRALPKGARVLIHCASGNRVAGALYTTWVLDEGMSEDAALALAKKAGLKSPVTEAAAKAYVAAKKTAKG